MSSSATLIQRPNTILSKITDGEGTIRSAGVDPAKIAKAEQFIQAHSFDYQAIAIDDWEAMRAACEKLHAGDFAVVATLHRLGHDMKGQAATFGYDFLTEIAGLLANYTKHLPKPSRKQIQLIEAHIDIIHLAIAEKIQKLDDPKAIMLQQSLRAAIAKT